MNLAPGVKEATMSAEDSNSNNQQHHNRGNDSPEATTRQHTESAPGESPPLRKDTISSSSTNVSNPGAASDTTVTNANSEQPPVSPTQGQSIFSVKDGSEIANNRRASRRRTGPLSAQQREKAALIRKLGACIDCRRRRVACHPNHHGMSWEDAMRKFRSASPTIAEIAPMARPISPAPVAFGNHSSRAEGQDGHEMDIDDSPTMPISRPSGVNRKPLPSGPRQDRPSSSTSIVEPRQSELQVAAATIARSPYRSRYSHASALLLYWNGEDDPDVPTALQELSSALKNHYQFTNCTTAAIPGAAEGSNPWRWMNTALNDFMADRDQRDSLKVVVYSGYSHLDANREMVLASSRDKERASTIRWNGIQQILEEACSDTVVLMDSAYYPSTKTVRQKGVLEFLAAAGGEDHVAGLGRSGFTKTITRLLHSRAQQLFSHPLTVAELHARLLAEYASLMGNLSPEREMLLRFPTPLYMQVADNPKLASILLAPIAAPTRPTTGSEPHVTLTFKVSENGINFDSWAEWFRAMPDDVRDLRVDGAIRANAR